MNDLFMEYEFSHFDCENVFHENVQIYVTNT